MPLIENQIEISLEVIISSKAKVYKEYLYAFCKEAGLDLDSDYNGNTELATELILKLLKQ